MTVMANRAVLDNGSYFGHCGVPESMGIRVCAAIQNGRAVGVTVHTAPRDRRVQKCVAAAVRELRFPADSRLDVTHSEFAPL